MVAVDRQETPPCRWRIVFIGHYGTETPALEVFEEELRRHAQDPTLCCLSLLPNKFVLLLASSWDGYLQVDDRIARRQLCKLGGHEIDHSEPVFTKEFAGRIQPSKDSKYGGKQAVNPWVQIFARCYGPILEKAVGNVLRRARDARYEADELLSEVWVDIIERAPHLLSSYSDARGAPEGYLYRIAKNRAIDILRADIRSQYIGESRKKKAPKEPSPSRSQPQDEPARGKWRRFLWLDDPKLNPSDLLNHTVDPNFNDIAEHELVALFEAFESSCVKSEQGSEENDLWSFFVDDYIDGLSTKELMEKYRLSDDTVYQRRHRIRKRLQAIWTNLFPE